MASQCAFRRFFAVDEALSAILDTLDSDDSGDDGASLGATSVVGVPRAEGSAHSQTEADEENSRDASNEDWEDVNAAGKRFARDFRF